MFGLNFAARDEQTDQFVNRFPTRRCAQLGFDLIFMEDISKVHTPGEIWPEGPSHFNLNYCKRMRRNCALFVVGRTMLMVAPVIWFVESAFQLTRFVEHSKTAVPAAGNDCTVALTLFAPNLTLVISGGVV